MSTEYTNAGKPLEDVFATVIAAHHPELESARWKVVLQDRTMKQRRKEVIGKVVMISGLNEHLTSLDFVFLLSAEAWNSLSTDVKEAFIDSLCCRIETLEDTAGFRMRPLDFAGMLDNVERYGMWNFDLRRAKRELDKAKQLKLPLEAEAAPEKAA